MTKPPVNVLDLPLEQRAEMPLKAAVEKVIVVDVMGAPNTCLLANVRAHL